MLVSSLIFLGDIGKQFSLCTSRTGLLEITSSKLASFAAQQSIR
jgi:hypothetical protein